MLIQVYRQNHYAKGSFDLLLFNSFWRKFQQYFFFQIFAEILVVFSVHFLAKLLLLLLSSQNKNEIIARLLLMFGYSTAVVLLYFSYGVLKAVKSYISEENMCYVS